MFRDFYAYFCITLFHNRREDGRDRDGEDVLALDSLNASNLGLTQVIKCMTDREGRERRKRIVNEGI